MSRRFRILPHTSEIGLWVSGRGLKELFRNAAFGLLRIYGLATRISPKERKRVCLRAQDPEGLLVRWLGEIIYLVASKKWLFRSVRFPILTPKTLEAELAGSPLDCAKQKIQREVKAATYHGLEIRRRKNRVTAKIIFDV